MRLSRAAYAIMIKFSEYFDDFQACVDEADMLWETLEGDDERDIKMRDFLKTVTNYDHIQRRWESASKMR
jgi:hypothetical protein